MEAWARGVDPSLVRAVRDLISQANRAGIPARVTSGRRTHAQQRALYRRYLAGLNPYPVAPPGTSDHERGWAVDLWAESSEATRRVGRAWRDLWRGAWSEQDEVHFGMRR